MTADQPTTVTPEATALVPGRFTVDGDGRPWLVAARCSRCGVYAFPWRPVCPRCTEPSMEETRVGNRARLFSFTVCSAAPAGWRAPYLQAYVELEERVRVFTLISDTVEPRADALQVGMPMELVVEPVGDEESLVTCKYRPAAG